MPTSQYKSFVKKYFLILAMFFSCFISASAIAFYIIDPLQFFHRSYFLSKDMLSDNMREQAIGIIKHYEFDSVILGTSMLENTSASEASSKLDGNYFNLSVRASDFYERSFILDKLLSRNISNIIYSMDHFYLYCSMGNTSYDISNWKALYGKNPVRFFYYYATWKNFFNLFKNDKGLKKANLDTPFAWKYDPRFMRRFGGINNWAKNIDGSDMQELIVQGILNRADKYDLETYNEKRNYENETKMFNYLNKYVLSYVRNYPETQFHLVFPPYYRVTYAKFLRFDTEQFFAYLESIKYLVKKCEELKNMHIYGFEDEEFLDDINNYADIYHYHPRYNSFILDAIAQKKELSKKNIDEYIETIKNKAIDYNLKNFVYTMRQLIQDNTSSTN